MRISVVGIGNMWATDDAIGPLVVHNLQARTLPACHQFQFATFPVASLELLSLMEDCDLLLLVDATFGAGQPGTIFCKPWQSDLLTARATERFSVHGIDLKMVMELAQSLDRLPAQVYVYGIEIANTHPGRGLSPAVSDALPQLVSKIYQQIQNAEPFTLALS